MKVLFYEFENKGGIYKITNLVNGKFYIGSAKKFSKRYRDHFGSLRNQSHRNKYLQASFNKYGESNFLFEAIETVEGDKLRRTTREQEYFDYLITNNRWDACYNLQKTSVQNDGFISDLEAHKLKQSILKKEFYKTIEGKKILEKIAENRRGKSYEDLYGPEKAEEVKEKIRQNKLIEMNKPEIKENLSKQLKGKSFEERFGKEKAKETLKKMSKSRKGKYTGKNSSRFRIVENVELISPNGKLFTKIEGIKNFAIQHDLPPNRLCEMLNGKRKTYRGWIIKLDITGK